MYDSTLSHVLCKLNIKINIPFTCNQPPFSGWLDKNKNKKTICLAFFCWQNYFGRCYYSCSVNEIRNLQINWKRASEKIHIYTNILKMMSCWLSTSHNTSNCKLVACHTQENKKLRWTCPNEKELNKNKRRHKRSLHTHLHKQFTLSAFFYSFR